MIFLLVFIIRASVDEDEGNPCLRMEELTSGEDSRIFFRETRSEEDVYDDDDGQVVHELASHSFHPLRDIHLRFLDRETHGDLLLSFCSGIHFEKEWQGGSQDEMQT